MGGFQASEGLEYLVKGVLKQVDTAEVNRSLRTWVLVVILAMLAGALVVTVTPARPAAAAPAVTENFDTLPADITRSSSAVDIDPTVGSPSAPALKANGSGDWWTFNSGGRFSVNGNFDLYYDIFWPTASSTRDIANLAFWSNGPGGSPTGFMYRLQNGASDGGFYQVTNGTPTWVGATAVPALATNTWYRVHLVATGTSVGAVVVNRDAGTTVSNVTANLSAYVDGTHTTSGTFGQKYDGAGNVYGHYWDNFRLAGTENATASVTVDPSFSFSVAGRPASCNGEFNYATGAASSNSVAFNHMGTSQSQTAGQDLVVGMNAGGGFAVYVRGTQVTRNLRSSSYNFLDSTGAYATPVTWVGAGTEAFGYTYLDTTSSSNVTAAGANKFIALTSSTTDRVMGSTSSQTGSSCVSFGVSTSSTTPAGAYSASVIYTAVPAF